MSIIGWVVTGLVAGALANWLVPARFPGGLLGAIVGGVIGAFLGGAVFSLALGRGVPGFDAASLLIAFLGAAALLTLLWFAGRPEPDRQFDRSARA